MKFHLFYAFVIVSLMMLAGCSHKQPARKYFIFEFTNQDYPAVEQADTTFDVIVDVLDFRVARAFDQTRMVVRTQSNELNYYYYHHWAVRPSYAIPALVYDYFEYKNVFRRINRGISYNPDYIIIGEVKSIERIQTKAGDLAHIHILFEFQQADNKIALIKHEATLIDKFDDPSMNGFVKTLNHSLVFTLEQFKNKITNYLDKHADYSQAK
ncbi:MAG: ABC-type transport auxiliary lipoprotein family protein [candidate division KSB1 bacterium]|nr:ABC-type transport auxiliary lipoprotein family protein [candidate division KSB1 bacterium]